MMKRKSLVRPTLPLRVTRLIPLIFIQLKMRVFVCLWYSWPRNRFFRLLIAIVRFLFALIILMSRENGMAWLHFSHTKNLRKIQLRTNWLAITWASFVFIDCVVCDALTISFFLRYPLDTCELIRKPRNFILQMCDNFSCYSIVSRSRPIDRIHFFARKFISRVKISAVNKSLETLPINLFQVI